MLSKPISLALVYILTIFNFLLLTLPFLLAIFPFMHIHGSNIVFAKYISFNPKLAMFLLIFIISFLMLSYLVLDFLFGISVRSSLKNCAEYDSTKDYQYLEGIFNEVKNKFGESSVKLYINHSKEINAFAVGSLGRKVIVVTDGLLEHYANNTNNDQEFLIGIRSILGHEMSHLINKDFLPGLLIITNQKVTNFVSGILMMLLKITMQIATYIRAQNRRTTSIILAIYNVSDWILTFFNRYVVYNLYKFLNNFLSRSIEYRADRQSAKAFGGINMAFALSMLGKSGYFTLFSTHPATQKRIKKVEVVEEKNAIIRASAISRLVNFTSLILLPLICFYTATLSRADLFIKFYLHKYYPETYYDLSNIFFSAKNLVMTYLNYFL